AKNLDAALVEAEKAAVVDPEGAQGYLAQGKYFESIGNFDEALAHYTTAVNAKTGQRERFRAALALAAMYETYRKAVDRAEADYEVVIKAESKTGRPDPGRGLVMFRYAYCLAEAGRDDDALAAFDQAIAANGPDAESRFQRGLLYERKNDHIRAIREFREGLK